MMIDTLDPKITERPVVRCAECDREVEHYNTFLSASNEERNVCWACLEREEKGFIGNRPFYRQARSHTIPR